MSIWRGMGRRLRQDESGVSLLETLIVAPVVMLLGFALIEFGAFLHAKSRVETGVRDAARYLGRCADGLGCDAADARNLAVFGNIAGAGPTRVQDWAGADIVIWTATPGGTWTANAMEDGGAWPDRGDKVRVETDFGYTGSLLLAGLGFAELPIVTFHEDVYYGR